MKNEEKFDLFIKNELLKSSKKFNDDGFKQTILDKLPNLNRLTYLRSLIIYIFSILAYFIFIILIDKNTIWKFIAEFYLLIYESVPPSFQTILFISIFILIFVIIPKIEFRNGIS